MENIAIIASKITKKYKLYNNPIDRLKDSFSGKGKYSKEFSALNDISFEIKKVNRLVLLGKMDRVNLLY